MNSLVDTPVWQAPSRSLAVSASVLHHASTSAVSFPREANFRRCRGGEWLHAREITQLRTDRPMRSGTSLLAVARAPTS